MRVRTSLIASVPPVEAPMATILYVLWARDRVAARRDFETVFGLPSFFTTFAEAAAFTLAMIVEAMTSIPFVISISGLAMTSTAPASKAFIVVMAPSWVSELTITTGTGKCLISFPRKVMPSILGISTSRAITSGFSLTILSLAI